MYAIRSYYATYLSLMHRPFHYYLYLRYSGMFTTVTVTSVYLGLVFSTVVVSLLGKMQKSSRLMNLWPQLMLLGIVSGYQFLTLSRTGVITSYSIHYTKLYDCKPGQPAPKHGQIAFPQDRHRFYKYADRFPDKIPGF